MCAYSGRVPTKPTQTHAGEGGSGARPSQPQLCARHRAGRLSQGAHVAGTTALQGGAPLSQRGLRALVQWPLWGRGPDRDPTTFKPALAWLSLRWRPAPRYLCFNHVGCRGDGGTPRGSVSLPHCSSAAPKPCLPPSIVSGQRAGHRPAPTGQRGSGTSQNLFWVAPPATWAWRRTAQVPVSRGMLMGVVVPNPDWLCDLGQAT